MRPFSTVSSRLLILSLALASFGCPGPADDESAADPMQRASSPKALEVGEPAPATPAPSSKEKEAVDLRVHPASDDPRLMTAAFSYSTSFTNSATTNTANVSFNLVAGQTITLGTCGVNGASGSGDTFLRFYNPGGVEVAGNDQACGGSLSNFTYTVPASGSYLLRAGCWASTACSGTVAYAIGSALFSYSTSFTNSATVNTADVYITLNAGQVLSLGTCGLAGASGSGDTYLRFYDPSGVQVAFSDNACGALSNFSYTIPISGTYLFRAGCWGNTACNGTVAYRLQ